MSQLSPASRIDAQKRADEIRAFGAELLRLQREGVLTLTDPQKRAISDHHRAALEELSQGFDVDRDVRSKRLSLGMRVASLLGALALAASVFLLVRQFWGLLRAPLQVSVLIVAVIATFLATAWLRRHDDSGYFTKLAALVSFACFVVNIAMVGAIFNVTPTDNALLPWAAYALLLAYACDLRLLLVAGLACVMAFIAARVGEWSGLYWIDFGERPENFFAPGALVFAVPMLIDQDRYGGFASTYRIFGLLALFLPALVLAHYGSISYAAADPKSIEHFYQVLGFVLAAVAIWLGASRDWADTVNTGVTFFVVFLYTKFYDWFWDSLPKYLFFLLLGLTALLALWILRRVRLRRVADVVAESA